MKKNASKIMFVANIIIVATILLLNYFYQHNGFVFLLKVVCSAGFVLLGMLNLCYILIMKQGNKYFSAFMAMGLLLAFLGDIRIDYNFIIGASLFAGSHICFAVAYCLLYKTRPIDLILSGILFLGASFFLQYCPILFFEMPIYKFVCMAYALIISLMLGKAIGNCIKEQNLLTIILLVASGLFFFSDLVLVLDWFIGLWDWTANVCMGTYYPALCLLAVSIQQSSWCIESKEIST